MYLMYDVGKCSLSHKKISRSLPTVKTKLEWTLESFRDKQLNGSSVTNRCIFSLFLFFTIGPFGITLK